MGQQYSNFTEKLCFEPASIVNIAILRKDEFHFFARTMHLHSSGAFTLQPLHPFRPQVFAETPTASALLPSFRNFKASVRRFIPILCLNFSYLKPLCKDFRRSQPWASLQELHNCNFEWVVLTPTSNKIYFFIPSSGIAGRVVFCCYKCSFP